MLKHGSKPVDTIWVHQLTTRPDWMEGKPVDEMVAEVRRWHKSRGWSDVGYHYIIDREGNIGKGRDESQVGAHVAGHNTGSIGISLAGGHGAAKDDPFERHFTPQQDAALRELIEDIKTRANIKRVRGHCEVANKVCPGFNVAHWIKQDLAPPRTSPVESTTVAASGTQLVSGTAAGVAALSGLHGTAQLVALAFVGVSMLAAAWIMRERLIKWAEGVR